MIVTISDIKITQVESALTANQITVNQLGKVCKITVHRIIQSSIKLM